MNAIPPPADLSKLKGILGNAKAIMNKGDNYESGHVDSSSLVQDTSNYVNEAHGAMPTMGAQGMPQQMGDPTRQMGNINPQALANSKMPEAIKQAMINNPIAQPTMANQSFSLEDVADLVEKPIPAPQARPRQAAPQQMNEAVMQNANDSFTVSETALRGIIKDVLIEYLAGDYQKTLTEGVIKKTINTLIKEGKIKTKK